MSYTAARMEKSLLMAIQDAAPVVGAAALAKQAALLERLREEKSLLVAFSGGADSAYLAWAAHRALGARALAITALSPSFSRYDRKQAEAFVAATGVMHEFIETREFENSLYVANGADRCYHCKDELFSRMEAFAREKNFRSIAYGINLDDTCDFRPGHRAAREHRILAPLLDAQLCKAEIRLLSRRANLATWDRPASACLSSRVPYGTAVTPELLEKIEQAEAVLREMGFRQFRVRALGELARIELDLDEMPRGMEMDVAAKVAPRFEELGFTSVTLDPDGYRQGSLNALLRNK
ncbi:MAG TPA: ATP-dependent sacrificial sulfur transferase LarE [Candidatus Limnocylindrales bacterium]|nr:ATP-dependent sacrificial sulfur transferase LarE [Candidatus Limnocylindrales bacterium]